MFAKLAAACLLAFALPLGLPGAAAAQHLSAPGNLVYTPNGQLLVASSGDGGVVTFQADGGYVGRFATGTGQPFRLALYKNQDLFVGMLNSPDVSVYTLSGKLLRAVRNASGVSLAVTSADYLVSIQPASLELFNKNGALVQTITQDKQNRPYDGGAATVIGTAMYYVSGPTHGNSIADTVSVASLIAGLPREREHFFNTGSPHPEQVAVDGAGHYYIVGDTGVLTVYSHFGALLLQVGGLAAPSGVAVDPSGNIYVSERDANDVKVFDAGGGLIRTIR